YVRNTERSQIVSLKLATHLLTRTSTTSEMWWHVPTASTSESTSRLRSIIGSSTRGVPSLWRHSIFKRTLRRPVISAANSALDLRVLKILLLLLHLALILGARLPVCDRSEHDIFRYTRCIGLRPHGLALLLPELRPLFALGDARV